VTRLVVSARGLRLRLPTRQLAIRRIEFDHWLLQRAGARVIQHHAREITQQDGGYVVDGECFGRYLVGAGGTHCPVARTFFADVNPRLNDALIVTQEEEFAYPHALDGPGNACHLWFLEHGLPGYAWYVPKAEGIVNVGVGGKAETLKARGETIHEHWAHLVAALDDLGLVRGYDFAPKGHAYYVRQDTPQLRVGNAFVVGDAAGLATSDMGEGIAAAVRSGLLIAEAIATGKPIDVRKIRRWSQPGPIGRLLAWAYR
jgi:flavin-dependent dehydrogenase